VTTACRDLATGRRELVKIENETPCRASKSIGRRLVLLLRRASDPDNEHQLGTLVDHTAKSLIFLDMNIRIRFYLEQCVSSASRKLMRRGQFPLTSLQKKLRCAKTSSAL